MQKKKKMLSKAEIVYNIKHFIKTLPFHFLVMGSVFIIATIFNKYIEALCFLIAFFSLRYKFDTTYHSDSIVICMTCTISIFSLSIIICPPIYMYLLFSIFFAYLDCLALWYIQDKIETKKQNKFLKEQIEEIKIQNINTPKEELLIKCRNANLGKRDTEIAIKYFIEKQKPKEIWLWLCENKEYEQIDWDSVHQLLWRIGKKINKK